MSNFEKGAKLGLICPFQTANQIQRYIMLLCFGHFIDFTGRAFTGYLLWDLIILRAPGKPTQRVRKAAEKQTDREIERWRGFKTGNQFSFCEC